MREETPFLTRDEPHQVALDLDWIVVLRQAESLREPPDVRIDDDALRIAELRGDDVRRLARNSGQTDEVLEPPRHLPVELFQQHFHRASKRFRLLPVEAG